MKNKRYNIIWILKWLKDKIWLVVIILISISCIVFLGWCALLFFDFNWISKWQIITWILIPMICALICSCISIALDNSLSNEKLKLALERLEWWRKYRYKNENEERSDWTKTDWFDKEYKLIYKNRWKSSDDIKEQMKNDKYRDEKFSRDALKMGISKEDAKKNWIEDHFIY